MKGRWKHTSWQSWHLLTVRPDGGSQSHACVYLDACASDKLAPWCVYTTHTEGSTHFATAREAKLYARNCLRRLLRDTEPLR